MYCPTCGEQNTQALNYCKHCGANLNASPTQTISPLMVTIFLALIAFITVMGFTIPILGMSELSNKGFGSEPLMTFAFFFVLATFGIDFMLIRLLSRLLGFSKQGRQAIHPLLTKKPKYDTSQQNHQRLPELPTPVSSVTEHTTRNFEPIVAREQHSRETS